MQNPLNSVSMFNPAVPDGTFRRGFFKGAGSGALMMVIFSGLLATQAFVLPLLALPALAFSIPSALGMIGMGTVATGLFTGITATQRAAEAPPIAHHASHQAERTPVRAPEAAVAPAMERAAHNTHAWTEKVSKDRPHGRDHITKILADGKLSDKDRAAAILSEREQSSTLNASR